MMTHLSSSAVELPTAALPGVPALPIPVRGERAATSVHTVSPAMYLTVFGAWAATLVWFHPRLASLLDLAGSPLAWAALAFFIVFTEVAWLYGLFNVGVIVFATVYRHLHAKSEAHAAAHAGTHAPAVALLYTTCNDFVERSALSCVSQDYENYTVYILDDSSHPDYRAQVDRFAAAHPERVRVVRRPNRRGFKAGNLNHGLSHAAITEPLFGLVDADEVLPRDFLAKLAPRLAADTHCGFIQANHKYNPEAPSAFGASLGQGIDVHWKWYQPLRNRYGFVMLLGHGALIRREAWAAIGGFPEIVSEDLAFALRIREKGWRGRFAEDVVCYEDFPETMRDFRVRHMKWTRGTCEFLVKEMRKVLRSPNIPLVEKLDVLFPTLNLPLSLLYFLFILDANVLLVALFGQSRALTVELGGAHFDVPFTLLDGRFLTLMSPDFYAITLLTLLAPVLCFILDMWRTPLRLLRFLGHSTAAYGTLGPLSSVGVMLYAVTGKAVFHVTADRGSGTVGSGGQAPLWTRMRAGTAKLLAGSHPDHPAVQGFEILCGIGFGLTCLATFQVSFLGLAIGFVLLPVLHHARWESPLLRALVYVPFAFILLGIVLGGMSLVGMQTVLFGYGFHF